MKPEKHSTSRINGLIIGIFLGLIVGFGLLNQTKKSLRNVMLPYALGLGTIFLGISGYRIGLGIDENNYRDECLGINKISSNKWKDGRYWNGFSAWSEYDGIKREVLTKKIDGKLVTFYNEKIISIDGNSASEVNVTKFHNKLVNQKINELKISFSIKENH